jgi:class 3 adenylate cyclase/tetratricopeptide (TPR) repeat protein
MEGQRFCQTCGTALTPSSEVCNTCGKLLAKTCPACGRSNDSAARFCAGCGAELTHVTGAAGNAILSAERKYITIMFVDMIDSVSTTRDMDPEEVDDLFRNSNALVQKAVHSCSGLVARRLGDGIMAVFGAPVALEDHALGACHAALRILEAGALARSVSPAFRFRIGIHSGLVVVSQGATDFSTDYEPSGNAVAIAARLQTLARPNTAVITSVTRSLLRDRLATVPLGLHSVKGLEQPIELFEIAGRAEKVQWAAVEPDEHFVARTVELEKLSAGIASAVTGNGRAIAVVGDAGIGKTCLLRHFIAAQPAGLRVLRATAERYGAATPQDSVRTILAEFLVLDRSGPGATREAITRHLTRLRLLDRGLEVPLGDLFELEDTTDEWNQLDPVARQRATVAAILDVLAAESELRPLIIVIEDVHWADSATIRFLDALLHRIGRLRIFLLLSSRPLLSQWPESRLMRIDLGALDHAETTKLIYRLIGPATTVQLLDLIADWSLGNPLFVHETVRALVDLGYLVGPAGERKLARQPDSFTPPASVTAIIAERIDHLPLAPRELLRNASVLGQRFTVDVLAVTVGELVDALWPHLIRLEAEGFIHQTRWHPKVEFVFHHSLFQEVCYASILRPRRRQLHASAYEALSSAQHGSDQSPAIEQLAQHAFLGGCAAPALHLSREAGRRALYRSANREAVRHFERALAAHDLAAHDSDSASLAEAIDLQLELRLAHIRLLELAKVGEILADVHTKTIRSGDRHQLARITGFMAAHAYLAQGAHAALGLASTALRLAREAGDDALLVVPNLYRGMSCHALGRLADSVLALNEGLRILGGVDPDVSLGVPGRPIGLLLCWTALSNAELGDFDEAQRAVHQVLSSLGDKPQPFDAVFAEATLGFVRMKRGEFQAAACASERALTLAEESELPFIVPVAASQLGWLVAKAGQHAEGQRLVRRAVQTAEEIGMIAARSRWYARLADTLLMAGEPTEASIWARQSLEIAEVTGEETYACYAIALQAKIDFALRGNLTDAAVALNRAIALADRLRLAPWAAKCRYEAAVIYRDAGEADAARPLFAAAHDAFRTLRMPHWAVQAAHELD